MKLSTYNPIQNLDYLFDTSSFFGEGESLMDAMNESVEPRINIKETDSSFVVEAYVAGYSKDEVNLEVEDNTLTISGRIKENNGTNNSDYWKREFFCSSFKRHLNLSDDIESEKISAEVKDGILIVNLPKKEKVLPKRIPITVN